MHQPTEAGVQPVAVHDQLGNKMRGGMQERGEKDEYVGLTNIGEWTKNWIAGEIGSCGDLKCLKASN